MLAILAELSVSKELLQWNYFKGRVWIYNPKYGSYSLNDDQYGDGLRSDFDIKYNGLKTTYQNNGWWPVFYLDDERHNLIRILGDNDGVATYKKVTVTTNFSRPLGDKYLLIEWIATNNDDEPHFFSLSSHTDIMLDKDDYATVDWYNGDMGLTMREKYSPYVTLTLIVRGGYGVVDVDDFYFDKWEKYNQHYWENRVDKGSLYNKDSCFSIGWRRRPIYPNTTERFAVLLGVGDDLKNPPIITVTSNLQENYLPDIDVTINFNVKDVDTDDIVTVYYNYTINNQTTKKKVGEYRSSQNSGVNKDLSIKVTLGSAVSEYPIAIWAEDYFGLKSNVFTKSLLVNEAPRLIITNTINSKYYTGGVVEVQGRLWDDTYAYVSYRFDDSFQYSVEEKVECYKTEKPILKTFPIKEKNLKYGPHTLYIWATDEFGVKSQEHSFKFDYIELHTPEIEITQVEPIPTYHFNEYILIKGKVRDLDNSDTLTISYLPPGSQEDNNFMIFDTVVSNGEWRSFEMIYQIQYMEPGEKKIIFKVTDQTGSNSGYKYYRFNYERYTLPTPLPSPTVIPLPTIPPNYTGPTDYTESPTYTCSSTTDINGDPSCTWTITLTEITITVDVARTPRPTLAPTEIPPNQNDAIITGKVKKQKDNITLYVIIGCAVAGAIAIITAIAIIVHEFRKPPAEFNPDDPQIFDDGNGIEFENDNPMFDENAQDDPFADDFDNPAEEAVMFPQ